MNVSRRRFLHASSLAGVAAIAAGFPRPALGRSQRPLTPLPKEVYASPLYALAMANFYANIGTIFTFMHPTHGRVEMRLVEVADLKPMYGKHRPADKESFSMTFIGPRKRGFEQGTYRVTDSRLGPFELFIVPSDELSP